MPINLISSKLFWRMRAILCVGFLQAGIAVFLAISVKNMLDGTGQSQSLTSPLLQISVLLSAAVLASVLKWRERILSEQAGQTYTHDIRIALFDHISRMSYQVFHRQRKGPILLRFMNDLTALRQWVTLGLSRLLVGVTMILIGLPAIWRINIQLGFVVSLIFVFAIISALIQGAGLNTSVRYARKQRSVLAGRITEKLMMVDVIQRMTARQIERRNVSRASKKLVNAMRARADRVGRLRALSLLAGNLCVILLATYSVVFRDRVTLSSGDILAALTLVSFMTPALFDLGRVFEYWQGARIAAEKIDKIFEKGPLIAAPEKGMRKRVASSRLRITNLHFASVFDGLNLDVKPGKKILISGKNGSGKSTLLRLIMRLDEPDSGDITLGRTPIAQFGLGSLRRAVSLVANEDMLIKGTIAQNLKYPNRDKITEDDLALISALNLGLNDKGSPFYRNKAVTEFGKNLSQGQKAILLLARALLRRPKILLIDEIDVHLDDLNGRRFLEVINNFPGSVILISHQLQNSEEFDDHYQLHKGKLMSMMSKSTSVVSIRNKKLKFQGVS